MRLEVATKCKQPKWSNNNTSVRTVQQAETQQEVLVLDLQPVYYVVHISGNVPIISPTSLGDSPDG